MSDTTLSPSTNNLSLGRGIVYFDLDDVDGNATGERDLGECSLFDIEVNMETLKHYTHRGGLKTQDAEVPLEATVNGKITLDEYSKYNLILALYGTESAVVQVAGSVASESVTVHLGCWMKLDYRSISNLAFLSGSPVEDTDYRVDETTGRVYFCQDTAIFTEDQVVNVSYDYSALNLPIIQAFGRDKVEGLLRFIGDPQRGPIWELEAWKVQLSTNTAISFISDEWGSIELNVSIQGQYLDHPNSPFFNQILRGVAGSGGSSTSTTTTT